ncbi:MAG TPA: single-stranded-DNA-specific exonuclease RecJ [Luteimonas sp.]|nr:single-stranded-DNA-specific exonuclease RecJ [Luteimonas sp.]
MGEGWAGPIPPLLRRIYAARGAHDEAAARPRLAQLLAPDSLTGIDTATGILADAIAANQRILVVGDFDCDGATACAVMVRGLRMLGAQQVEHAVPNRMVHGYGLSPALVADLAPRAPDLLVTVDHGIACHAGIAAARALGWTVLVTDHHLPGAVLPAAHGIVNPNLAGDRFPSKALAGVGVAFYVLLALRARLRRGQAPVDSAAFGGGLTALLDLVAVGTIADLVPLDANNRAMVSAGLRQIRSGRGCAGLQALIAVAGRDVGRLTATDIGFAVAPRLNAAGRLEDMALGIDCLLTDDAGVAHAHAATLNAINVERRRVQQSMVDEADLAVALPRATSRPRAAAVCLFDAGWHPGVIGLVASKLKERLHRPVVAFAPAEPGGTLLRGSARSIAGFHMRDALAAVDVAHPGLIDRFGGHAMAAGLSLAVGNLTRFEAALQAHAEAVLDPALLRAELESDGELEPHEFDHVHALHLREGGPWGQGFPEPLFDGHFDVLDWRIVAERHLKLSLRVVGAEAPPLPAIQFGGWRERAPGARVHIAYRLVPDDYRGGNAVQLIIEHCVPVGLAND